MFLNYLFLINIVHYSFSLLLTYIFIVFVSFMYVTLALLRSLSLILFLNNSAPALSNDFIFDLVNWGIDDILEMSLDCF